MNSTIESPSRSVFGIHKLFTQAITITDWLLLSFLWAQEVIIGGLLEILTIALETSELSITTLSSVDNLLIFFI